MKLLFKNKSWMGRLCLTLATSCVLFLGACSENPTPNGGGNLNSCASGETLNSSTNECEAQLSADQVAVKKQCEGKGLSHNTMYNRCIETILSCKQQGKVLDPNGSETCTMPTESQASCDQRGAPYNHDTGLCIDTKETCKRVSKILSSTNQCVTPTENISTCSTQLKTYNNETGLCQDTEASCAQAGVGYDGVNKICTSTSLANSNPTCAAYNIPYDPVLKTCIENVASCSAKGLEFDSANPSLHQCKEKKNPDLLTTIIGALPSILPVIIGNGNSSDTCTLNGSSYAQGATRTGTENGVSVTYYCCNKEWRTSQCQ